MRVLTHGGVPLLDGYELDEMAAFAQGQALVPWPNRLADGRYDFAGRSHRLALTEPASHNAITDSRDGPTGGSVSTTRRADRAAEERDEAGAGGLRQVAEVALEVTDDAVPLAFSSGCRSARTRRSRC